MNRIYQGRVSKVEIIDKEGEPTGKKAKLLATLRDYQKENPTVAGSVRLFEVLLEKENWLIWQEVSDSVAEVVEEGVRERSCAGAH